MKPIYYADQMVTAYEIAMGLPEARRMTNDDGNFKTEVTQQNKIFHIFRSCFYFSPICYCTITNL